MKIGPPFNYGDGSPGGRWIIDEPELHLGEDIIVPDIAGWRCETMTEDMELEHTSSHPLPSLLNRLPTAFTFTA